MLLNQAIATQQRFYSEIQTQIESLQEQQRQIQAYLQRLGSVESKMESAAALVAEAIAEIRNVCPEELMAYEKLITGLFESQAIAQIAATVEPEPASAPEPTPVAPVPNPIATVVAEPEPTTIDVVATPAEPLAKTKEVGESQAESATPPDFSQISWKQLQKLASSLKIDCRGKKRFELETEISKVHSEVEINQAAA